SDEPMLKVFASELASDVLQQAREGVYPQEIAASISQDRLERFFVHENGRYRVRRELRDIVTFANHDLFKDPPYSHLDLIVCRNLLRDLQPNIRQGVLSLFYYALEPQGALLIGHGKQFEAPGFLREVGSAQVLRREGGAQRLPSLPAGIRPTRFGAEREDHREAGPRFRNTAAVFRNAIERYTPPSVLVDGENQVVHFSHSAARYVHIPGGELTLDVEKLLPPVLAQQVLRGLHRVREELRSWQSDPFAVAVANEVRRVRVRVDRTEAEVHANDLLLVVFDDAAEAVAPAREFSGREALDEVLALQAELARLQGQLTAQAGRGAATTAAEGAQAQREHDEHLHEVVNELEDAREELQTLNEELISLSDENQ